MSFSVQHTRGIIHKFVVSRPAARRRRARGRRAPGPRSIVDLQTLHESTLSRACYKVTRSYKFTHHATWLTHGLRVTPESQSVLRLNLSKLNRKYHLHHTCTPDVSLLVPRLCPRQDVMSGVRADSRAHPHRHTSTSNTRLSTAVLSVALEHGTRGSCGGARPTCGCIRGGRCASKAAREQPAKAGSCPGRLSR